MTRNCCLSYDILSVGKRGGSRRMHRSQKATQDSKALTIIEIQWGSTIKRQPSSMNKNVQYRYYRVYWPRPQKVGGQKWLYTQMVKGKHEKHDQRRTKKHDTQIVAEQYNKPTDTWETKFPTAYKNK